MTEEDKNLLLIDLSGRLSYGVKIFARYADGLDVKERLGTLCQIDTDRVLGLHMENEDEYSYTYVSIPEVKPYLFPLSSMTEEQKQEYQYITERWMYDSSYSIGDSIDWLNKNHFDYLGLIEKGLALEAPEGMYN